MRLKQMYLCLEAFLGYANCYDFIPNMIFFWRAPLSDLLKKGSNWYRATEFQKAFDKIKKKILMSDMFLLQFELKLKNNHGDRC